MISFIVPAHNEQACLGRTLQAIHQAARAVGQPYEIIVVDDASTDATAEVARQHNAIVLPVSHRQISATRNAGARAARGERLFFVDADTIIDARAVAAALQYMDNGAVGGGAPVRLDKNEDLPLYARLLSFLSVVCPKLIGFTGGACMFCTREAFQATGGFNERLYWSEEGSFALRLKREGRFVVLWRSVVTSGRRMRTLSGRKLLKIGARFVSSPFKVFTRRDVVEGIWYDSNRVSDHQMPDTFGAKISNAIVLVLALALASGIVWDFIPRSWTPLSSPIGKIRLGIGILCCHVGLILWPIGLILLVNLLRQKRWTSVIHSLVLIAFCFWQARGATRGVIWLWTHAWRWLTT